MFYDSHEYQGKSIIHDIITQHQLGYLQRTIAETTYYILVNFLCYFFQGMSNMAVSIPYLQKS